VSRIARIKQELQPHHIEALVRAWLPKGRWSGRAYMVCSPFRNERTPSFAVYDDGGWHDFGSGLHGDMLDLTCRLHGVTLQEAIQAFEQMLGLECEQGSYRKSEGRKASAS
jgi:DNA primase